MVTNGEASQLKKENPVKFESWRRAYRYCLGRYESLVFSFEKQLTDSANLTMPPMRSAQKQRLLWQRFWDGRCEQGKKCDETGKNGRCQTRCEPFREWNGRGTPTRRTYDINRLFVRSHDLAKVDFEKRTIIDFYRADILKYGGRSKHKILGVFNAIPGALASHGWQFPPGAVRQGAGMREFDAAFEWLRSSMMVNVAYHATDPNVGLELSSDHHSLKCFLGEVESSASPQHRPHRGQERKRLYDEIA